uniref:Uncharacterized protein n=1 Tax=viral metagenome TaxID=1070528 RepID=A0A6C0AE47_9ZZZZ
MNNKMTDKYLRLHNIINKNKIHKIIKHKDLESKNHENR